MVKRFLTLACIGGGSILALLGSLYYGQVKLIEGLPSEKIALLYTGICAAVVIAGGFVAIVFWVAMRWSSHAPAAPKPPAEIQTSWTVKEPPQLQAPRQQVYVPRYTNNGQSKPLTGGIELTTMDGSDAVSVRLVDAVKFAELPTPARHEWTGKKERYGLIMRWYGLHGLLVSEKGGGGHWHPDYPKEARLAWLQELAGGRDVLPYSEMVDER